jgi:hypothetical protein
MNIMLPSVTFLRPYVAIDFMRKKI